MPCRRYVLFFFLFVFLLTAHVIGQWQSIGSVISWEKNDRGVRINTGPGILDLQVFDPSVIRVRFSPTGEFRSDSSWAVLTADRRAEFQVKESIGDLMLITSDLRIRVQKFPCRITFFDKNWKFLNVDDSLRGIAWSGHAITAWKKIPEGEHYYGFGEKSNSLEKSGTAMSMWNSDIPAYTESTDPLYQDIPFYYGICDSVCYGTFLDNSSYSHFIVGKEDPGLLSFGVSDGDLNYYFFYGPSPEQVLRHYTELTGHMPMPPKWALGYQQCRWSYYPEQRVREIASIFRNKKIPCDVLYLDIHYMDGYRVFTWDSTRFPAPKRMIDDLTRQGFKIVVIIDPGIKVDTSYSVYRDGELNNVFVKRPDRTEYVGKVWPGDCAFPDFTRPDTRKWWGSLFSGLIGTGIRGFWNDMNEPSVFDGPNKSIPVDAIADDHGLRSSFASAHNIYGMQMVRATREGAELLQTNERPFVLTRANYAGGQRYAAAWTGDNVASWEHLRMGIRMCLGMSISGQPFIGTDIGGFIGMPTGELYARWLQFGVFSPLMRSHAEINSPNKEPWEYGPDFEAINRRTIEQRYELLPYFYTAFRNASVQGGTLMRPLVFDYPADQQTIYCDDEFLFGNEFLVAPVVESGQTDRQVYLPAGVWYDYRSGEKIDGRRTITAKAPIDQIPVYVKGGSVIPTQAVEQYTDEKTPDRMTLTIFPFEGGASGTLYEDDGISFDYKQGKFAEREIAFSSNENSGMVIVSQQEGTYRLPERSLIIDIRDYAAEPSWIHRGSTDFPRLTESEWNGSKEGWIYSASNKSVTIRIRDNFGKEIFRLGK